MTVSKVTQERNTIVRTHRCDSVRRQLSSSLAPEADASDHSAKMSSNWFTFLAMGNTIRVWNGQDDGLRASNEKETEHECKAAHVVYMTTMVDCVVLRLLKQLDPRSHRKRMQDDNKLQQKQNRIVLSSVC